MYRNIIVSTYQSNVLLFKNVTSAYFEDNYLEYSTDSDNIKINLDSFSFIKESGESILRISRDKCTLFIKELKQSMDIPLEYISYNNDNNLISIEYKLISQEEPIKIIIEIGSEINEI